MRLGLGTLLMVVCGPPAALAFMPVANMVSHQRALVASQGVVSAQGLSIVDAHVCSAGCPCARRRRTSLRMWAAEADEQPEELASEEAETEEEQKQLSPEEQAKQKLKEEIKELEAKLAVKRNDLTAAQDRLKTVGREGYLRLAAEVDTYKRRRADSLSFVREEAVKEAMKQMVSALDALESLEGRFSDLTNETEVKIVTGYNALQNNFIRTVDNLGLKTIAPAVGDKVDDMKHMVEERVVGDEDDAIVEVVQKGYEIQGRLVRPATVRVSVTEATLQKEKDARAARAKNVTEEKEGHDGGEGAGAEQ